MQTQQVLLLHAGLSREQVARLCRRRKDLECHHASMLLVPPKGRPGKQPVFDPEHGHIRWSDSEPNWVRTAKMSIQRVQC